MQKHWGQQDKDPQFFVYPATVKPWDVWCDRPFGEEEGAIALSLVTVRVRGQFIKTSHNWVVTSPTLHPKGDDTPV